MKIFFYIRFYNFFILRNYQNLVMLNKLNTNIRDNEKNKYKNKNIDRNNQ